MILYCATTNPGKLREFRLMAERFSDGRIQIESVPGMERLPTCVEDGATFEENAVRKAIHYSQFAAGLVFADDSGLEVRWLGGAPGIHSARFAGERATDEENNRLLLRKLEGAPDRRARFVCVIAVAEKGKLVRTFRGEVEGVIAEESMGSHGFGYDPLFIYEPEGKTFAQLSAEEKMQVSHRGKAMRQLIEFVVSLRDASPQRSSATEGTQ